MRILQGNTKGTLRLKLIGLVALTCIASCHPTPPRVTADDLTRIQTLVDSAIPPLMEEYDVPGMAVSMTIGGELLFFSYGVASRESGIPVNEETLFEIGSVSKAFTGTLAAYRFSSPRRSPMRTG